MISVEETALVIHLDSLELLYFDYSSTNRGHCPSSRPGDPRYTTEAVRSLCKNLAGVVEMDAAHLCDLPCNGLRSKAIDVTY